VTQHQITDAEYAAALAAGQSETDAEVRVRIPVIVNSQSTRS
jgi:hypothetical protein